MATYINSISNALYTTLSSNSTLVNSDVSVCLYEVFNTDPNMTPWVGIYWGADVQEAERLVAGIRPWRSRVELQVFLQCAGYNYSAFDAQDDLDRLWTSVHSAMAVNLSLDNTVRNIISMQNEPFERNIQEEDTFFTNLVTLTVEVEA